MLLTAAQPAAPAARPSSCQRCSAPHSTTRACLCCHVATHAGRYTSSAGSLSKQPICTAFCSTGWHQPVRRPPPLPQVPTAACAWRRYACCLPFSAGLSAEVRGQVLRCVHCGWPAGRQGLHPGTSCMAVVPVRKLECPDLHAALCHALCCLQRAAAACGECWTLGGLQPKWGTCGRPPAGATPCWRPTPGTGWRSWRRQHGATPGACQLCFAWGPCHQLACPALQLLVATHLPACLLACLPACSQWWEADSPLAAEVRMLVVQLCSLTGDIFGPAEPPAGRALLGLTPQVRMYCLPLAACAAAAAGVAAPSGHTGSQQQPHADLQSLTLLSAPSWPACLSACRPRRGKPTCSACCK
jgi:hypothetical protein